jgi:hypothetical protein
MEKKEKYLDVIVLGLISVFGLVIIGSVLFNFNQGFWLILLHAAEGGFIGGICDNFAVWKINNRLKKDQNKLAEGIGLFVKEDLLFQRFFEDQFENVLTNPRMVNNLYGLIHSKFPDVATAKDDIEKLWIMAEPIIKNKIVKHDFTSSEKSNISGLFMDEAIHRNIRICLSNTILKTTEREKFLILIRDIINQQGTLAKMGNIALGLDKSAIAKFTDIANRLKDVTYKPSSEEEKLVDDILALLSLAVGDYIFSWEALSGNQKAAGVEAVLKIVKGVVCENLAHAIISSKKEIKSVDQLWKLPIFKAIIDSVDELIDERLKSTIATGISDSLKKTDIQAILEPKTAPIFNVMKLMGTCLGFILGAVVGFIMYSFH